MSANPLYSIDFKIIQLARVPPTSSIFSQNCQPAAPKNQSLFFFRYRPAARMSYCALSGPKGDRPAVSPHLGRNRDRLSRATLLVAFQPRIKDTLRCDDSRTLLYHPEDRFPGSLDPSITPSVGRSHQALAAAKTLAMPSQVDAAIALRKNSMLESQKVAGTGRSEGDTCLHRFFSRADRALRSDVIRSVDQFGQYRVGKYYPIWSIETSRVHVT